MFDVTTIIGKIIMFIAQQIFAILFAWWNKKNMKHLNTVLLKCSGIGIFIVTVMAYWSPYLDL